MRAAATGRYRRGRTHLEEAERTPPVGRRTDCQAQPRVHLRRQLRVACERARHLVEHEGVVNERVHVLVADGLEEEG